MPLHRLHRREFLQSSGAAAAAFGLSGPATAGGEPCAGGRVDREGLGNIEAPERELTVISQQPQYYHGWPTITRRRSGQLVVVNSAGRESHVCPFGRVELMTSNDDGGPGPGPG